MDTTRPAACTTELKRAPKVGQQIPRFGDCMTWQTQTLAPWSVSCHIRNKLPGRSAWATWSDSYSVIIPPPPSSKPGGAPPSWWGSLLLEFPLLATHGALVLRLLSAQPLHDAVDVKAVAALAPHQRTVITSTSGRMCQYSEEPLGKSGSSNFFNRQ